MYLLGWPFVVETDHRALEWLDALSRAVSNKFDTGEGVWRIERTNTLL